MNKCRCDKASNCKSCACAKAKEPCSSKCHGGFSSSCGNFAEARKVRATMNIGELRKSCASFGLSPVGDKDELVFTLGDYLRKQGGDGSVTEPTNKKESVAGASNDGSQLLQDILGVQDEPLELLSLSGLTINSNSSVAILRKAYLKLSVKVHPDKHGGSTESNLAFQALVTAFELLTKPPEEDEDLKGGKRRKVERVKRSNANCYKTKINCPRCTMTWGGPDLGLEKGAYQFFMEAIKTYICGRCFCNFGCMTAIHMCPFCRKPFDYDPSDFHRQISCGNDRCKRPFGFEYLDVNERRYAEVRKEAKQQQEEDAKQRAQRLRRNKRSNKRVGGPQTSESKLNQEEILFTKGLVDNCPRCGVSVVELKELNQEAKLKMTSEELVVVHLSDCNDAEKIKQFQKEKKTQERLKQQQQNKEEKQNDAMTLKAWELQGKQVGQLWMLTDSLLRSQCELNGIQCDDENGEQLEKPILIGKLAKVLRAKKPLAIMGGSVANVDGEEDNGYDTVGIAHADYDDLPQNLNAMEVDEIKAVCASYGIKYSVTDSKSNLLKKIDLAKNKGNKEMTLMLTNKRADGQLMIKDKAAAKKRKAKNLEADQDYTFIDSD